MSKGSVGTFAVSTNTPPSFLSNNFYSPIKPSKKLR